MKKKPLLCRIGLHRHKEVAYGYVKGPQFREHYEKAMALR